jgi:AmpE protein
MTFIVTLVGLLIERFFDWSHLRHWSWYMAYQRAITHKIASKSPYLALAMTIVPVLILVALLDYLLQDWLYGFLRLVFDIVVFIYCLGPKDLWADAFACTTALGQPDADQAAEKIKTSFGVTNNNTYSQSLHKHLLNNLFIEANRRVFAVVFWFVVLGPVGSVMYRAVTLSASDFPNDDIDPSLAQSARSVEAALNWLPIRIFTFLFALGGHFAKVLSFWRKHVMRGLDSNEVLLMECGVAALGSDEQGSMPEDGSVERSAISLLDRAFVITLVIIAIMVLLF